MKKYILYSIIAALILMLSITYVAFGVSVGETHVVKMERMSSDSLPRLLNESSLFETSWNLCCSIRKLKTLKSGEYQIEQGISTWDLVELMRQGDQSSILIRTDETRTLEGFCESLSGSLQFKKEEYLAAICAAMGSDTSAAGMAKATSVLFANSFAFQYSDTPEEIAKRFKNMHDDYWNEELRFLRYSVQDKAPWMLQYHDKLEEDSYYIYQSLSSGKMNKTKAFWKIVTQFMIHSENISADLKAKYSQL